MRLLLVAVALPLTAAAAPAQTSQTPAMVVPVRMHGVFHPRHTLPDPPQFHVCRVFKHYGGGVRNSRLMRRSASAVRAKAGTARGPAW